jgi:hypothetical protein
MRGAPSQVQPTSAGQPLQRPLKRLGIESHRSDLTWEDGF